MTEAFRFDRAITRLPSSSVGRGLRSIPGEDPDRELFSTQHEVYRNALADAGVTVSVLPPLDSHPDAVFVEDTALCFPDFAVLLRPGAPSRRGEEESIGVELARHYGTVHRLARGHVDGGDVLWTGTETIIGLSSRTTPEGAKSLAEILSGQGMSARVATTPEGVLHFKSDSSVVDNGVVLSTTRLAESGVFADYRVLQVPAGEELAANCIRVNDTVLLPAGYPQTEALLQNFGLTVVPLDNSEPAKIDGGLSCMSLRLPVRP